MRKLHLAPASGPQAHGQHVHGGQVQVIRARPSQGSASRNPLVVQFWLLGLDAAQGHLLERGFSRAASPRGSSLYTLDGLTLHSRGLWLDLPQERVHYLRPRQAFYGLAAEGDLFSAGSRPPADARYLTRAQGLRLALPFILEHERWTSQHCGPDWRSGQLAQRMPGAVRRLVPAWNAWMSGRHLESWTLPQLGLPQTGVTQCPPVRLVGAAR